MEERNRFRIDKDKEIITTSIPHFYDTIDRMSVKESGNKTNGFPKFPRFKERDMKLKESNNMPSSQSYNGFIYNSIEGKAKDIEPYSRNIHSYFKSIDKFEFKTYFKELERGYVNKDTPGPAAYSTENQASLSKFRMSLNGSFSKERRKIHDLNDSLLPGPQTYNVEEALLKLDNIKGAGTIGKSRIKWEVTHYGPLFRSHTASFCFNK